MDYSVPEQMNSLDASCSASMHDLQILQSSKVHGTRIRILLPAQAKGAARKGGSFFLTVLHVRSTMVPER
jgi:hypothetical protein